MYPFKPWNGTLAYGSWYAAEAMCRDAASMYRQSRVARGAAVWPAGRDASQPEVLLRTEARFVTRILIPGCVASRRLRRRSPGFSCPSSQAASASARRCACARHWHSHRVGPLACPVLPSPCRASRTRLPASSSRGIGAGGRLALWSTGGSAPRICAGRAARMRMRQSAAAGRISRTIHMVDAIRPSAHASGCMLPRGIRMRFRIPYEKAGRIA